MQDDLQVWSLEMSSIASTSMLDSVKCLIASEIATAQNSFETKDSQNESLIILCIKLPVRRGAMAQRKLVIQNGAYSAIYSKFHCLCWMQSKQQEGTST